MATQMTKSQLIEKIAAETELPKKGVKEVFETLATIGYKELKRTGVFLVPGFVRGEFGVTLHGDSTGLLKDLA